MWSHWSPRNSGKTTQSLLLIMETVAASLGLKITLKISLLLGHYFLGFLPFAAPTWNSYRTITVWSSTSGSNKKKFCCREEESVQTDEKKQTCGNNVWVEVEDGGRTTVKQQRVGQMRTFQRDRIQWEGKISSAPLSLFGNFRKKKKKHQQRENRCQSFNIPRLQYFCLP